MMAVRLPSVHEPEPLLSAHTLLSLTPSVCANSHHACAGKKLNEAHSNFKKGTATEREIAMVVSVVRANTARGTNPGYVVVDDNGHKRNARVHYYHGNKPRFNISLGRGNTYHISTGCSELMIGSSHTDRGHTFTVLHPL